MNNKCGQIIEGGGGPFPPPPILYFVGLKTASGSPAYILKSLPTSFEENSRVFRVYFRVRVS